MKFIDFSNLAAEQNSLLIFQPETSVPDKRGVAGQKPDKAGNMTRQNKLVNLGRFEEIHIY